MGFIAKSRTRSLSASSEIRYGSWLDEENRQGLSVGALVRGAALKAAANTTSLKRNTSPTVQGKHEKKIVEGSRKHSLLRVEGLNDHVRVECGTLSNFGKWIVDWRLRVPLQTGEIVVTGTRTLEDVLCSAEVLTEFRENLIQLGPSGVPIEKTTGSTDIQTMIRRAPIPGRSSLAGDHVRRQEQLSPISGTVNYELERLVAIMSNHLFDAKVVASGRGEVRLATSPDNEFDLLLEGSEGESITRYTTVPRQGQGPLTSLRWTRGTLRLLDLFSRLKNSADPSVFHDQMQRLQSTQIVSSLDDLVSLGDYQTETDLLPSSGPIPLLVKHPIGKHDQFPDGWAEFLMADAVCPRIRTVTGGLTQKIRERNRQYWALGSYAPVDKDGKPANIVRFGPVTAEPILSPKNSMSDAFLWEIIQGLTATSANLSFMTLSISDESIAYGIEALIAARSLATPENREKMVTYWV